MNNQFDFTTFSRQSKKGILVIYLNLLYSALRTFWILLFLFIKDFSKFSNVSLRYIYLGFTLFLLFFLIRAILLYKNFQFKIIDGEFRLKQGILKKTNTSISFDRIQNINFKQNIIQQIIDVYQVDIETAGSNKTEISIKALSQKEAEALKSKLSTDIEKLQEAKTETKEKPFLKISPLGLLKVSVTENHLKSLFLFVLLLIGLFYQVEEVFKGFGREGVLEDYLNLDINSFQGSIILFLILVLFLLFLGVIISFVRVFLVHFNLIVLIKNQAFQISQGLLTKKSIILKTNKIQNITISSNPIKKKLGISFITFKQAVSGKVNKKQEKTIKVVGCEKEQVNQVKKILFDTKKLDNSKRNSPHKYFKNRIYFWSLITLIIINGGFFLSFQSFSILFANLLFIPLFILWIEVKYRKTFYKIDDELVLIGTGSFDTHFTYLQFYKVQNVKLEQSYFQARKNIADLVFQTASGEINIPCVAFKKAIDIYNHTLFKVEGSSKPWM